MDPFLVCTGVVTLAEIGDKTQLLALVLASRFRQPWTIASGILLATLINHAFATGFGAWLTSLASPQVLRWGLGLSFIAMGAWLLVPDRCDADAETPGSRRLGAFATTAIVFFFAEMGDKTQLATVALGARFGDFLAVLAGTTTGMMLANLPVILIGECFACRLPLHLIRVGAATIFAAIGLIAIVAMA